MTTSRHDPDGPSHLDWPALDLAGLERVAAGLAVALPVTALRESTLRVALHGELGAGKTTLVRLLLRALGHTGRVKSPTFALLEPYNLPRFDVHHLDLYRLADARSWLEMGLGEVLAEPGLALVEWPERAGGALPAFDLDIVLERRPDAAGGSAAGGIASDGHDDTPRRLQVRAGTEAGRACLSRLAATPAGADAVP